MLHLESFELDCADIRVCSQGWFSDYDKAKGMEIFMGPERFPVWWDFLLVTRKSIVKEVDQSEVRLHAPNGSQLLVMLRLLLVETDTAWIPRLGSEVRRDSSSRYSAVLRTGLQRDHLALIYP